MIRYTLRCAADHRFESWFQSSEAYDVLASKGLVSCALCGNSDVEKALMAPRVAAAEALGRPQPVAGAAADAASSDTAADASIVTPAADHPLSRVAHPAEQMLRALREHLAKNSTYVGGRFASEARAIHLGDADPRPIHGEATPLEARSLIEEGIAIAPLPILPPDKTN